MNKNDEKPIRKVVDTIDGMRNDVIDFLSGMIQINSVNPAYSGKETEKFLGGETKCNEYIRPTLEKMGCKTDMWAELDQRTNLVGVLKGTGGGKSLILNGHVDTVPLGDPGKWTHPPLSGELDGNRVHGRGACDMKGGIAAMIKAVEAIQKAGYKLKGDIIIQTVIGEETGEYEFGTMSAIKRGYRADAAIVTEPVHPPDRLAIQPTHGGLLWVRVTVKGKAAHIGVRYELIRAGGKGAEIGVSAIDKGIKIYNALMELERDWGQTKNHRLFPPGFFCLLAGVIDAGPTGVKTPFVVPDNFSIDYGFYYPPEEDVEDVKREIEEYIGNVAKNDPWLKDHPPIIEWKKWIIPTVGDENQPIVKELVRAYETVTGESAIVSGFVAACDTNALVKGGVPAVIFGPGSLLDAHTENEYVPVDELMTATKAIAVAALNWCGYGK